MFMATSILLAITFCAAALLVPLCFPRGIQDVIGGVRRRLVGRVRHLDFNEAPAVDDERERRQLRYGAALAVLVFLGLGFADRSFVNNSPEGSALTFCYATFALFGTALLLGSWNAYRSVLPRLRTEAAVQRAGIDVVSTFNRVGRNRQLRALLLDRASYSPTISITDITGFELLGKGTGKKGSLLYDVLRSAASARVNIVLYRPEARDSAGVQTLFNELNMSQTEYTRRVNMTMDAVDSLNKKRSPEAQIRVKFYGEKPTFRAIVFEQSCLVMALPARDDNPAVPVLEFARIAGDAMLHESFRRNFVRLWSTQSKFVTISDGAAAHRPGASPTARSTDKQRAISGSFAVKPVKKRRPAVEKSA